MKEIFSLKFFLRVYENCLSILMNDLSLEISMICLFSMIYVIYPFSKTFETCPFSMIFENSQSLVFSLSSETFATLQTLMIFKLEKR